MSPSTASQSTDDLRIRSLDALSPPSQVIGEAPSSVTMADTVRGARQAVHDILHGTDDRLAVVIGPCSIHDPKAALEYARGLAAERERHAGELEVLMRVYFEKPRTTVGWKGLINDPGLDGGFRINDGLRLARDVLLHITQLGLPAACEFLDVTTPQYLADLVAWAAIGARTTESQIHREMASGLSCPVGFKNGTNGDVKIAVDAVLAAIQPHHFLAVNKDGRAAIAATTGNIDAHIVLRGGKAPNYDAASVAAATADLAKAGLPQRLMVDASHANSGKRHENQLAVVADLCAQLKAGEQRIMGVMVESHLAAGRQDLVPGRELVYGQSITDACIDWETSAHVLDDLAAAVRARRALAAERLPAASSDVAR
ncbi:MAG TPA: 3-deoxy-7-phosphoheptulonate synthase [Caulobacteraceae bacterium]|jgi:3-deoxy-7-phosphoheptulonate synthase|nr:3-deoxy-7-phosphoheptulonate synthase [Caulobacteraceae bacterium]